MATITAARPGGATAAPRPTARKGSWFHAHPYVAYLVRRLLLYFGSLWGAFTVTFLFFRLIPGDPIQSFIMSLQQQYVYNVDAGQEVIAHYRKVFGLEGNLFQQYLHYMQQVLINHDFGPALIDFPTPAQVIVLRALPWTIGLLGLSAIISWVFGLGLGTLVGWRRTSRSAQWLTNIAIAFSHVPAFFIALMLLFIFAYRLALLPSSAAYDSYLRPGPTVPFALSVVRHGLLPAISIVAIGVCNWMIGSRMLVVTTLGEDYLTFADAKGLRPTHILTNYALRNCFLPLVTAFGISLGIIFNGNVVVERVFNYPGVGNLLVQAIGILDFNTIQAIVSTVIFAVLTANLVIDILLPVLDPRVKYW
jgi:peptide/nickel transport system permease protein